MEKLQNKFKNRLPQEEHPEPYSKVSIKRKYEDLPQKPSLNDTQNINKDESDQLSLAISNKKKKISRTDESRKVTEKHENV